MSANAFKEEYTSCSSENKLIEIKNFTDNIRNSLQWKEHIFGERKPEQALTLLLSS